LIFRDKKNIDIITTRHPRHTGQYTPSLNISIDRIYRQNNRPNVTTDSTSFAFLNREPMNIKETSPDITASQLIVELIEQGLNSGCVR